MIYPLYIFFAAEYELRCMRNALDMGDNEEIIDIAKRFYRVCVLLLQLSFIMVSYTELVNCSVSESALLLWRLRLSGISQEGVSQSKYRLHVFTLHVGKTCFVILYIIFFVLWLFRFLNRRTLITSLWWRRKLRISPKVYTLIFFL